MQNALKVLIPDLMNGANTIYIACSELGEAFACSKHSIDSAGCILHDTVAFQRRKYQVCSHCLRLAMTELLPTSSCMLLGRYFSTHSWPPPEPAALCDADVPAASQSKVIVQVLAFKSHCIESLDRWPETCIKSRSECKGNEAALQQAATSQSVVLGGRIIDGNLKRTKWLGTRRPRLRSFA